MAVELVPGQVVGGEQVTHSAVAFVGRPSTTAWLTVRVLVLAAAFGPLLPGVGHQVEWSELVQAEDDFGLAVFRYDLALGDAVEVLDPRLLGRVVQVLLINRSIHQQPRNDLSRRPWWCPGCCVA